MRERDGENREQLFTKNSKGPLLIGKTGCGPPLSGQRVKKKDGE